MKYPVIRPGIGVNVHQSKLIFKLYNQSKKLTITTNTAGIQIVKLLDGTHSLNEILNSLSKSDNSSTSQDALDFITYLETVGILQWNDSTTSAKEGTFARQLTFFNMFPSIKSAEDCQTKLAEQRVCVIGAGGLGSAVSEELVKCGVTNLTIVDPDIIESKNLSNQTLYTFNDVGRNKADVLKTKLSQFFKKLKVTSVITQVTEKNAPLILKHMDFVFTCADFPSVEKLSSVADTVCLDNDIPHIVGGGYSGHRCALGMLVIPNKSLCWNCYLKNAEYQKEPGKEIISPNNTMSFYPLVKIVASLQVTDFIKYTTKITQPSLINKFTSFNLDELSFNQIDFCARPECKYCYKSSLEV